MKTCPCGQPLHYNDPIIKATVEQLVADLGEDIQITVLGKGTYLVPRHYVALHGIEASEIEALGFPKAG